MLLEVQKYLRSGRPVNSLRGEPYYLRIKQDDNFTLLSYGPESDVNNPIVQECRGLILFTLTWDICCYSFNRFFNHNDPQAAPIDEESMVVTQKKDGSLFRIWYSYCDSEWKTSSRNVIFAKDAYINGKEFSMYDLFLKALNSYGIIWEDFTSALNQDYTYTYELVTQDNPVVIHETGYHLYYLGQRNNKTLEEEYFPDQRIETIKIYNYKTLDEVIYAAENELPDTEEGFVVRDKYWNRVKVKTPSYFLRHKLDNNGKPDFLGYVLSNEYEEFLAYCPQYKEDIDKVKRKFEKLSYMAKFHLDSMKSFWGEDKKSYATYLFHTHIPAYMQTFIFKTYDDHSLTWEKFTKDWDIHKWRNIFRSAEKDLIV